jgi:hypothetical protein
MDNNSPSVNYQRAVTPSLDSNYLQSSGTSKVTTSQQAPARRPINTRIQVTQTRFNPTGQIDAIRNVSSPRTFVAFNGGQVPTSPSKVLQRGKIMSGYGPVGPTSDLNLQGRAMSSQPMSYKNVSVDTSTLSPENNRPDIAASSGEIPSNGIIFTRLPNRPDTLVVTRTDEVRYIIETIPLEL